VCLVFEEVKRERVSAHVHTNEDANVGVNKKKINSIEKTKKIIKKLIKPIKI
jgi:hypothetical protein